MAYAELDDLKQRLRIPTHVTQDDEWLNFLLEAATQTVELATGRLFAVVDETTAYIDYTPETVVGYILRLPDDFHTITEVVNGDGETIAYTNYVPNPRLYSVVDGAMVAPTATILTARPFYEIQLKTSSGKAWTFDTSFEGAIAVTGMRGYSGVPPAPIKLATLDLATHMAKLPENIGRAIVSPDGMLLTPSALPDHVIGYLRPFVKVI